MQERPSEQEDKTGRLIQDEEKVGANRAVNMLKVALH